MEQGKKDDILQMEQGNQMEQRDSLQKGMTEHVIW